MRKAAKSDLPVRTKHDRLDVDHRLIHVEAANGVGDPLKTIREVGAASAPDLYLLALSPGEDAEAIVLVGSHGRMNPGGALRPQPGEGVRQDTSTPVPI